MSTRRLSLFVFLLMAACGQAFAQAAWDTDILTWTAPTQCTDSTLVSNCPVTGYDVQTAATATAATWALVGSVASTLRTRTVTGLAPGPHCYRVIAKSANGNSVPSNVSCVTTVKPTSPPNPPVLSTVDTVAYRLDMGYTNQFRLVRIGTMPLASPCVTTSTAMGLHVVKDRMLVTLDAGKTRPLAVLGKCG